MPYLRPVHFRGTNYFPSITRSADTARGLLDPDPAGLRGVSGFFSASQTNNELAAIRAAGFNNLRLFSSFFGWVIDARTYLANLATFCELCRLHGLTVTYVLWTTATADDAQLWAVPSLVTQGAAYHKRNSQSHYIVDQMTQVVNQARAPYLPPEKSVYMAGYAEPGTILFQRYRGWSTWPNALGEFAKLYLQDIASFFSSAAGQPVFASYDIFNEPDLSLPSTPVSREFYEFIAHTYEVLADRHPGAVFTCGMSAPGSAAWAAFDHLRTAYGVPLSYMSYHLYPNSGGQFLNEALSMARVGLSRQIDVVCSEFEGVYHNPFKLPDYARDLQRAYGQTGNLGGQVWGFLQSNVVELPSNRPLTPYFDGVLAPVDPGDYESTINFRVFDEYGLTMIQRWNETL